MQLSMLPDIALMSAISAIDALFVVEEVLVVSVIRLHCAIKFIDASPKEGSVMDRISKINRRIFFMKRSVMQDSARSICLFLTKRNGPNERGALTTPPMLSDLTDAAVVHQIGTCHVRTLIRGEVQRGIRHLLSPRKPANGDHIEVHLHQILTFLGTR